MTWPQPVGRVAVVACLAALGPATSTAETVVSTLPQFTLVEVVDISSGDPAPDAEAALWRNERHTLGVGGNGYVLDLDGEPGYFRISGVRR